MAERPAVQAASEKSAEVVVVGVRGRRGRKETTKGQT